MYRHDQAPPEQHIEHHALVAEIAAFLRPDVYVELGANGGATFKRVLPYVKRGFAVDIEAYEHLFEGMPPHGKFIRQDTVEFLKTLDVDFVDLVFLDSSHEFQSTLREFEEIRRVLRPNGVVLFHDSYPSREEYFSPGACGRVADAILVLKQQHVDFEFVTLPAQFGLTVARKHLGKQLLWRLSEDHPAGVLIDDRKA